MGSSPVGYYFANVDTVEAASTTTVLNLTAHVAKVGDVVKFRTAGANLGMTVPICSVTANTVTLCNAVATDPSGNSVGFGRPSFTRAFADETGSTAAFLGVANVNEDAAAASGDALVGVAGVIETSPSATAGAGDYVPPKFDSFGYLWTRDRSNIQEDDAMLNGQLGIPVLFQALSAVSQSVGTSGDAANPAMDLGNRQITTLAPAGETFQSCGTATATTGDVAIKAAVVSNRHYITAITCKNTSTTVATPLDFKDGSTIIAVGAVSQTSTAAAGSFEVQFPVPLRGTANTAINFATNVSTSSVTCCASGYISTI